MDKNKNHPLVDDLEADLRAGKLGRREFLRMSVLLGLSVAAAYGLTGLAMPETAQADTPKRGGNLKVSMGLQEINDPATFLSNQQGNVVGHFLENLTRTGFDGITRPHLLERWEASDDLKTWVLHLRRDVTWSNGDQFNADDVVFNITRWLDPATGSSMQSSLSNLTELVDRGEKNEDGSAKMTRLAISGAVERLDDFRVRLSMSKPMLSLPESLSEFNAKITHRGFKGDLLKQPVGTGPFTLESYQIGQEAILKRRPDGAYWGGDPYLDQITYIDLGDDVAAELAAFASGQIDMNMWTDPDQVKVMSNLPDLVNNEVLTASAAVARMNVKQKPFDDIRVRKAVQLAVDSAKVMEVGYQNAGELGENHHASRVHPDYHPLPPQKRDVAKARQLLAEAGYADGIDLQIDCVASPGWEANVCQVIADQVREAGIRLRVNPMPGGSYWDVWTTTPFAFTQWNHRPLAVQLYELAYRSGVPWNETGYSNPEFDALLDQASKVLDAGERSKLMAKLEQMIQDDAILVQPFFRKLYNTSNKRVRNVSMHIATEHHFNKVWLA